MGSPKLHRKCIRKFTATLGLKAIASIRASFLRMKDAACVTWEYLAFSATQHVREKRPLLESALLMEHATLLEPKRGVAYVKQAMVVWTLQIDRCAMIALYRIVVIRHIMVVGRLSRH